MVQIHDFVKPVVVAAGQSKLLQVLIVLVVMDVIFGLLRAIKEKAFNSSIGINGMIRKAGMLISLVCLIFLDAIIQINLIGFIPEGIREYLPGDSVGAMEFFAFIYIVYEAVSVLKNMTLAGLPLRHIWEITRKFLVEKTGEITEVPSDSDEPEEAREERPTPEKNE